MCWSGGCRGVWTVGWGPGGRLCEMENAAQMSRDEDDHANWSKCDARVAYCTSLWHTDFTLPLILTGRIQCALSSVAKAQHDADDHLPDPCASFRLCHTSTMGENQRIFQVAPPSNLPRRVSSISCTKMRCRRMLIS